MGFAETYMTAAAAQEWLHVAAYYLWQAAGSPDGRAMEFWFQAEDQFQAARINVG